MCQSRHILFFCYDNKILFIPYYYFYIIYFLSLVYDNKNIQINVANSATMLSNG